MNNLSTTGMTDSSMIGALELDDAPGIDDGTLERAARIDPGPTNRCTVPRPFGTCITDGALEVAGAATAGPGVTQRLHTACR